jgi:hypothetical protein
LTLYTCSAATPSIPNHPVLLFLPDLKYSSREVLLLGGQPVGPVGLRPLGVRSGRSGSYKAETQVYQYRTSRLRSREKKAERWKLRMIWIWDVPPEMFSPAICAVPPIAPSVVNSTSPLEPEQLSVLVSLSHSR